MTFGPALLATLAWQLLSKQLAVQAHELVRKQSLAVSYNGALTVADGRDEGLRASSARPATGPATIVLPTKQDLGLSATSLKKRGVCNVPRSVRDIEETDVCPDECPFEAEDTSTKIFCSFVCVSASECGSDGSFTNSAAKVADPSPPFCRQPAVVGCKTTLPDADICTECDLAYTLKDGKCVIQLGWMSLILQIIASVFGVYFVVWYVNIAFWRPRSNYAEEEKALEFRTATKLFIPEDDDDPETSSAVRRLWPITTNTLTTPVAGPGSVLYFRFLVFLAVVPFLILMLWLIIAFATDPKILENGIETPNTPREHCKAIAEGHDLQMKDIWIKILFLGLTYIMTILLCMCFAISQRRKFQELDKYATMSDFAAFIYGLPPVPGTEKLEDILKREIQEVTKQVVVGVSVGWDYDAYSAKGVRVDAVLEEEVEKAEQAQTGTGSVDTPLDAGHSAKGASVDAVLEEEVEKAEHAQTKTGSVDTPLDAGQTEDATPQEAQAPEISKTRSPFFKLLDSLILSTICGIQLSEARTKTEGTSPSPEDLAVSCSSSPMGFVVFETQAARDSALSCRVPFRGKVLRMRYVDVEPAGVRWQNFSIPRHQLFGRVVKNILFIVAAAGSWAIMIYLPYAMYVSSFSYINGDVPGGLLSLVMVQIVVIGNLIMYFLCAWASENIGFLLIDTIGAAYMVLYFGAVMFNVVLDLHVEGWVTYVISKARGARTFDGILIADMENFKDAFEAYDLQSGMGASLFKYCVPSLFLIPFLLEPIVANLGSFHLARRVVRTFPVLKGYRAAKALQIFIPMDAARYADILINYSAAVLIFFFPSGHILLIFLVLALAHLYIFGLDHFRVLRGVPSFTFSSQVVDTWAIQLLAIPTGFVLCAFIFKTNCHVQGSICIKGNMLGLVLFFAFLCNCAVYMLMLHKLVPMFDRKHKEQTEQPYSKVAAQSAPSWFNTNPMHCLRSQFLYKDNPPCHYHIQGMEHVLRKNPDIGSFFDDRRPAVKENYGIW